MRLHAQVQAYADKILSKRQRQIDVEFEKKLNAAFDQPDWKGGGDCYAALLRNLAEIYVERIRTLGEVRMESLLTAHKDAEIPLDKAIVREIKDQVISLCHNEQDDIYNRIPRLKLEGGVKFLIDDDTSNRIVTEVGHIMSDFASDLDIMSTKIGLAADVKKKVYAAATGKRWDAFISHASEDKEGFVRPLAAALQKSGLEIWFDETTLKVGDRLRESIDNGLSRSRFGVVVLSKHFFLKDWTKEELEGLTTKEIGGVKVILPVWHNVTKDEVAKHSPILAGRLAARSQDGLEKVVRQLLEAMGKEFPKPLEPVKKNELALDQENITPPPSISPVEEEEEYHERPTPQEMNDQIHKVSMLSQGKIADNYRNLKVKWRGVAYSVREISNGVIDFTMKYDGHFVCMKVQIDDYPILRTVRGEGDELVTVKGIIDYVQSNGPVHLKDVKLIFSLPSKS